jgi:hypothetical protein
MLSSFRSLTRTALLRPSGLYKHNLKPSRHLISPWGSERNLSIYTTITTSSTRIRCFFSSSLNRSPHTPGLAASILQNSPDLLLASTEDRKIQTELRDSIFERMDLKHPTHLPSKHSCVQAYHNALASLVVEETLYSISSSLGRNFDFHNVNEFRKLSLVVRVTGGKSDRNFFECYTHEPLSRADRKDLRAGSVVFMLPKGGKYSPENTIFGVIIYGSHESTPCEYLCPAYFGQPCASLSCRLNILITYV